DGILATAEEAADVAERIGYPVLLKATAGGGGKGMRIAKDAGELASAFQLAQAEAKACFSNGDLYMEKLILKPRHIEVQVMGDEHGNVVHLGERECS
ncbi:MAG TPA: acetyl-CoA carboxylase biotin carboxylase subunit, partial [Deltaproteobacteria bacterium]|nr:acetyl-CoA carboxylase biotin carboxylase subunit [Deltaproteobacteria bacterium]